jgi:mRNA-degrading endonuclease toxin of MazEF toxin-antitoxin module
LSAAKQRPAVVISADWFNRSRPDCVLAAITSQIPVTIARDEMLLAVHDLQSAGLPKSSLVRCGKVITIQQALIRKRLGVLPPATVRAVLNSVRSVLSTR